MYKVSELASNTLSTASRSRGTVVFFVSLGALKYLADPGTGTGSAFFGLLRGPSTPILENASLQFASIYNIRIFVVVYYL
jgi:hypothetical protein